MATFTIGSFGSTGAVNARGQSFTPNVAGPDGTGSPGNANPVYAQAATVGYASADTSSRAATAYLYDHLPSVTDLNSGTGALASSTGCSDGSVLGAGTYTRTFTFDNVALAPDSIYYVLFPSIQFVRYKTTSPYGGGTLINTLCQTTTLDVQFQVQFGDGL